jgi:trk system potassium uptake protein TrkH
MIIAGFNFNLIFRLLKGKGREILKNSEARTYFGIIFLAGAVCAGLLWTNGNFPAEPLEQSIRKALFQCVSILTTTGFSAANYRLWLPLAQGVLFFLMFIGGCSSSTAGGIKVIRHVILFKQTRNEIMKLLNPRGVFSIQINGKVGQKNIVHGVAGFFFLYMILVMIAAIFVSSVGTDIFSSFNIGLLTVGNIGLGIVKGSMESTLYNLPSFVKLVLSFIMIVGRLEIWTIFALLYWGR